MANVHLEVVSTEDPVAHELQNLISGEVRFRHHDRMLWATDASIYQVEPIGVVLPKQVDEAQQIVDFCRQKKLAILPRGGGTSLAGQAVNRAVVIDFSKYCQQIISIDPANKTVIVEPGVVLDNLNLTASSHGLMFGPDVATSTHATLGGMIGNNSAGAYSILYGRTVENVVGLEVLLADGTKLSLSEGASELDEVVAKYTKQVVEIIKPIVDVIKARYPKTLRRVNGYNLDLLLDQFEQSSASSFDRVNLAHLFTGSEGTLGVTLNAKLKLVDIPKAKGLAIIAFNSIDEALTVVNGILSTNPAAVELIDELIIKLARRNTEYSRYVDLLPTIGGKQPQAVLYVEYFGENEKVISQQLEALCKQYPPGSSVSYIDKDIMANAWKLRKAGEPLLYAMPGQRKPLTFVEDAAVNPSKLVEFIREFKQIVADNGTEAAYYAHASVGCLHIRPLICLSDPKDVLVMQNIASQITDLVKRYDGALSGEHGDGRARSHLLEQFYGPEICKAFKAIKHIFDPSGLMNPGNIVDGPSMAESLRIKPKDKIAVVPKIKTFYRYDNEGDFSSAVQMCNGAGMCRKQHGSTMCPSYRALIDERHSTRGRANALRLAITGQLSIDGQAPNWSDEQTIKTLDLCLSCKACKTECPSNVDVAKLKAEYTAQGFAANKHIPWRTRLFGNVRTINQVSSAMWPVADLVNRTPPTAAIVKWLLGIDPRRSLPRNSKSLYRWFDKRSNETKGKDQPTVILLPDCFTTYSEAQIGIAAVNVLEKFGYRVVLPKLGCCGRAQISLGLLRQAQDVCRNTASKLLQCVKEENAIAIVGCEPSCISAIKDDWLDLDISLDQDVLKKLADQTYMIEDFLEAEWHEHPNQLSFSDNANDNSVLLHGHCHQKALWGMESTTNLLKRIVGNRLQVLDSGCCGMAGAFGYTKVHYDLSMQIGELSLMPAVRSNENAIILAPGTSCRHQIKDATNRIALHPIELIASAI
ncbi:MAG: FAD-binding protein [Planctomycetes bacterium]|nr:FAD-binding protein [Planctomycetota bacterium]